MKKQMSILVLVLFAVAAVLFAFVPEFAFADDTSVGFAGVMRQLQTVVTVLLLPLGILIAAWRIIYLALVCGLIGSDPLGISKGDMSGQAIKNEIKDSLWGFVKGLCWVGGAFIVFQFALGIAASLAETLTKSFG